MESNTIKTLAPRDRLVILGLSLLAVALMLVSTSRGGPGLSPDSVVYVATARNIVNGLGATTYNLTAYVDKPPFYPMVLAGIKLGLGIDPLVSAPVVNAIALGLIVYLTACCLPTIFHAHCFGWEARSYRSRRRS